MIIAFDFDGILCKNAFPGIGEPNAEMVALAKKLINEGHEVILWTCRVDDELEAAVEWCKEMGINFCAVNENAPSNISKYSAKYPNGTRKVYADVYIDDHDPYFLYNTRRIGYRTALRNARFIAKEVLKWEEES